MLKRLSVILLTGLAACSSQPTAPTGAGLCWRMSEVVGQPPTFRVLARDVPNLESCAVQLEGVRMMEGGPVSGAYAGNFIFATEEQITSAKALDGTRIRIFDAAQRREVQAGLQALIDHQRSQVPAAS